VSFNIVIIPKKSFGLNVIDKGKFVQSPSAILVEHESLGLQGTPISTFDIVCFTVEENDCVTIKMVGVKFTQECSFMISIAHRSSSNIFILN